jgi:RNA polymerase sigma-70 factor (ECF subfamily)
VTNVTVAEVLATAASAETARIVSTVIRMTGDFALAEDCLQDAFARALVDWPKNGVPGNPGAWLTTVAKNRAVDLLRRAASENRALQRVALEPEAPKYQKFPKARVVRSKRTPMADCA